MERRFVQLDVFSDVALAGNPLAVVLDSAGLDQATMQRLTDWTNLSEVTFLSEPTHPEADYAVRIFSPGRELPFAGHPTLGSCHAWLAAGGKPKGEYVVQECGVGLVSIRRDGGRLAFAAPPRSRLGPLDEPDVERIARGLGVPRAAIQAHAWCQNGPAWRGVMLSTADEVLALEPDYTVLRGWDIGVIGPRPQPDETQFEVRAFFTAAHGVVEDPVTGSLNAALAQWLIGAGIAPPRYVAAQGTAMGRAGRVHVEQIGKDIWIGGDCVTVIEGKLR